MGQWNPISYEFYIPCAPVLTQMCVPPDFHNLTSPRIISSPYCFINFSTVPSGQAPYILEMTSVRLTLIIDAAIWLLPTPLSNVLSFLLVLFQITSRLLSEVLQPQCRAVKPLDY